LHEQVKVIRHEAPGENRQSLLCDEMIKCMNNDLLVHRSNEDIDPVDRIKGQEKACLLFSRIIFFSSHLTLVLQFPKATEFAHAGQMLFQIHGFTS